MPYTITISEGIAGLADASVDMAHDYLRLVAERVGTELPDCTLAHNADWNSAAPPRIAVLTNGVPSIAPEALRAQHLVQHTVARAWQGASGPQGPVRPTAGPPRIRSGQRKRDRWSPRSHSTSPVTASR